MNSPEEETFDLRDILAFRKDLLRDLRTELGHLKTCQTTLLVFSGAGSGIFFSLLRADSWIPREYLILLPLLFLLPLWIIFYDKARTIARIVGFLRVQEKLFMYRSKEAVVGWESAMKMYWEKRDIWDDRKLDYFFVGQKEKDTKEYQASSHITSATSSIYWFTVFLTYFLLCLVCISIGFLFMNFDIFQVIGLGSGIITILLGSNYLKFQNIGKPKENMNTTTKHEQDRTNSDKANTLHTNIVIFSLKARFVSIIFVITAIVSFIAVKSFITHSFDSFGFLILLLPLVLLETTRRKIEIKIIKPRDNSKRESLDLKYEKIKKIEFLIIIVLLFICVICAYILNIPDIILKYYVYLAFMASFIYCGYIATWMFLHLVKDRYNYGKFEKRWQIILNIIINEKEKRVYSFDWESELNKDRVNI